MNLSPEENVIKLYLIPGASSLFPHILLRHANIKFTPIPVRRDELATETFLHQINDKGQVPVLQIGQNRKITENLAIAYLIHQLAPEKHIFGPSADQHALVLEWLSWLVSAVHAQAWGPFLRPYRFTSDTTAYAAIKETSKLKALKLFDRLEQNLSVDGPYALGEHFTAVDAYILIFHNSGTKLLGVDMTERFPKWTRVVGKVRTLQPVIDASEYEDGLALDPPS